MRFVSNTFWTKSPKRGYCAATTAATILLLLVTRGVAREGGANLAEQLTLFKPRGADYAPHTTASPPGFKKLSTPLVTLRNIEMDIKPLIFFKLQSCIKTISNKNA